MLTAKVCSGASLAVVKVLHFPAGGAGSILGLGAKILHATQHGHKKVKSLLCKSGGLEPPPQEPNPGSALSFHQSFLTVSLESSTTPITSAAL